MPTPRPDDAKRHKANQARLRADLKRLGWPYHRLAEWLTELGEPTSLRTVERWMGSGKALCPAWPSLLLEALATD